MFKINLKFRNVTKWFLLLTMLITACASSGNRDFHRRNGIPFQVKQFNLAADSSAKSRLSIVTSVPYERLQFLKIDDHYFAKYFISLEIYDKNNQVIKVFDTTQKITLNEYKETVKSKPIYNWLGFFDLKPEEYLVKIKIVDYHSKLEGQFERKVQLKNFREKSINSSHLVFTKSRKLDFSNMDNILLDFKGDPPDSLFACLEFVQKTPQEFMMDISYTIKDAFAAELLSFSGKAHLTGERQRVFLPIDISRLSSGLNQIALRFDYQGEKFSVETKFYVTWGNAYQSEENINLSLKQLRVIANPKDIKKIDKAPEAQQDSLIKAYWKERDPTPETEDNELYDEFITRIQESNRMFGFQRSDGWRSDRGLIYLKYGPPDMVEKDIPSNSGFGKYEVWTYDELRRQYIFYDRLGTGEYRLVTQQ